MIKKYRYNSDNVSMKKAVLVLLLFISGLSMLCADTVLFCISDNRSDENPSQWTVSVLRAFEDGVMDVFFEGGHIITNSFLNECRALSGEGVSSNADVARILGNRLGADCVMILEIIFPPAMEDVLPVPEKAEYSLYKNTGRTVSDKKEYIFDIVVEMGEEELLDSFTELGKNIAAGLLGSL